jgi:Family of unknown function (DUF6011)
MSTLDPAIWQPITILPMPMLDCLRNCVLSRFAKRMPKWKFRAAPDIVVQVQPRPGSDAALFHCKAVVHDDAGADLLEDRRRPLDSWSIEFKLFVSLHDQADFTDDGDWNLKPTRVGFRTGHPHSDIFHVRDRLVGALPVAFERLRPETMLKPACLFCGRPLTDPVSMARWIGPECAGTAAAITPFTVNLAA